MRLRRYHRRDPGWSIDRLVADPVADLIGANRAEILRALALFEPLTIKDAVARTTLRRRPARKTLDDLVAIGLASQDPDGGYRVNDSYVLTGPLLEALDARTSAFTRIRALAAETVGPETTVAVYGSGSEKNLGVLIITHPDEHAAAELAGILERVLPKMLGGNPRIEISDEAELADRIERRDPTTLNHWWRSETVFGPNLADMMMQFERKLGPGAGDRRPN